MAGCDPGPIRSLVSTGKPREKYKSLFVTNAIREQGD